MRDKLEEFLMQSNIQCAIHYPKALPFLEAYGYLQAEARDFPLAWQYQSEILSLPLFPELADQELDYVIGNIKKFFSK